MAQNYTRQSTFADGDTITAALFNDEYNQLVNAFNYSSISAATTGHRHDGTAGEGGNVPQIGDLDFNNKIVVDDTNNRWGFFVEVASAAVEQLRIQDGAIVPVTDNDIDLGSSSLEFKNLYIDGTATIDDLSVDASAIIGTTLNVGGTATFSGDVTLGNAAADTLVITATVNSNFLPQTDSLWDLGSSSLYWANAYVDAITTTGNVAIGGNLTVTGNATISGNLTFGDADTDTITIGADVASNITPDVDDTYDLGSSLKEWRNLYIDGTANIDSLVADTADINAGTIDNTVIGATTAVAGSFTTATATTGNITNVNATTVDTTNIEVTNLKAKDGTSAGSIADTTGVVTLASSVLTTTDINGGTIDNTVIGGTTAVAGSFTTATATTGNITTVNATTVDTTNIEVTNLKAKDGTSAGSIADSTGVVTLASSVLTTTDINGGTIDGVTIGGSSAGAVTFTDLSDGTITITAFVDEDDMVSNSATLVPTQQSVKAYVDSQVTAQDLDFQGDTGGALSIDLDSETLTIAGGAGIDTSGATNTLTVAIDSTVTTLTGTQTLTNKTLTAPVISTISNTGTLTLPTSTDTLVGRDTTDTLTNKTLTTPVISSISNTGTLTLPTSTDTLVGRDTTDTLTNKTLTSPVINTGVSGTAILDDDTFATATATTLATAESIKAYVDAQVDTADQLSELTDVTITSPALDQVLVYNGSQWVNAAAASGGLASQFTPQTANFTAVKGNRYYLNSSAGTFTMTLPASPNAGDQVGFVDYGGNFATTSVTVGRNSSNIMGSATDMILDVDYFSGVLEYVDATQGWMLI